MSQQEWIKCRHCGNEHALFDGDSYTQCWHCDICGYHHSEPGDELWRESKSDRSAYAYVHSEWGRDFIPKELTVIKARKLSNLLNMIFSTMGEDTYNQINEIVEYLRFKYKITNRFSREDYKNYEMFFREAVKSIFNTGSKK